MKEQLEFVEKSLQDILTYLDIEGSFDISYDKTNSLIKINIGGDDIGNLIGYHGENIFALQNILLVSLLRKYEEPAKLYLDIGGYRLKREEKLIEMVVDIADKVRKSSRSYKMSPMTANDRRIVHCEISKFSDLISYSVGEGRDRRVIISKQELGN
ncbi:hypothetical protein COV24_02500 [candidate division WWE3 bacterium CG10_big_fil_rev_8_21_14_0_10_32_10]|uniref:R3H domain-containing protein n=1 Tax=candidate division WWE3 bacterium CG10_big_fil_rev_8_21_14_0_10_32_10 TaxID=1975090 RepID=A0A2H0RAE2_UNCKA|nr:MAG: hypothetical protein COV24_02500 [candidate division WWE3 bacterium CG10_big_fil_rev_8_21_14_0_10_32_10]